MLAVFISVVLVYMTDGATTCFQCNHMPVPGDCAVVTRCEYHEICFVEQVVTPNGNIVYNSGCRDSRKCPNYNAPVGRDVTELNVSTNIYHGARSGRGTTDVVTCTECCTDPYCNKDGCGTKVVDRSQRGPYCYQCMGIDQMEECRHVTRCNVHEECIVKQYLYDFKTLYESKCIRPTQCKSIELTYAQNSQHECVRCCDADFCNTDCQYISG
ncbi:uncharacterized protein LOC128221113 [Mya arenaria]|uniref:uncharacterized protein LOC128221113 n=1 Tax=Mya arenaria TaxID=6604 RepID=UPI0022E546AD|nr:uncharacterized protein LOC128221113 [Mya arenaria]